MYEGLLHLEPDFEVGPGPKYHVYLVPEAEVLPSTNVAQDHVRRPRPPEAFKGSQNYEVPAGVDVAQVRQRGDLVRAVRRADLAGEARAAVASAKKKGPL